MGLSRKRVPVLNIFIFSNYQIHTQIFRQKYTINLAAKAISRSTTNIYVYSLAVIKAIKLSSSVPVYHVAVGNEKVDECAVIWSFETKLFVIKVLFNLAVVIITTEDWALKKGTTRCYAIDTVYLSYALNDFCRSCFGRGEHGTKYCRRLSHFTGT